jgi:hypothetical protein
MKSCLFWVKEEIWDEENKIIPVFDVMRELPIRFLIYNEDKQIFEYRTASHYKPIANDWQTCCAEGAE